MKKSILFLAFTLLSLNANWDINVQECINKSNAKACESFTKKLSSECENKDKISCFLCDDGSSEACYELATKYLQGNHTE